MYARCTTPRPFTLPYTTICNERHFRAPAVRFGTVARSLSRTVHLDCQYTNRTKLEGPVVPRAGCVLVRYRSQEFPSPWRKVCSKQNFRTHSVRICTVPQIRTQTAHIGCVNTNYTYLGGPVAHCTPGVRFRYRLRQFTLPCTRISNERHFRTPSVRICTVPKSLSRTAHLGCEYINCTYLGYAIAHCTPGVRLRDRTRQFTLSRSTTRS